MLKDIQRGLTKFFTTQKIIVLIILIILAWGIMTYSNSKTIVMDNMDLGMDSTLWKKNTPSPSKPVHQTVIGPSVSGQTVVPAAAGLHPVANPSDLLPKDKNSQWAALNPVGMNQGDVLMPDLLQAGYHIGLDTIGQSLRNANLQLRSDPIIQKQDIGPWNQSTIEPDFGRVPLEVGQGPQ